MRMMVVQRSICLVCLAGALACAEPAHAEIPPELQRWLGPQEWVRDRADPLIAVGKPGDFDDTHVLGPAIEIENGRQRLWYCGSQGDRQHRCYRLGLATSVDGKTFEKYPGKPLLEFGDGKHSVLTPTLLRNPDGTVFRENGRLRLWYSSCWLNHDTRHTLHESSSLDGTSWSPPSRELLEGVYAPTLIKDGAVYKLWYTDVSARPWSIRYAESRDGTNWKPAAEPSLRLDQAWEHKNLFYPAVVKTGEVYLMWYGSWVNGAPELMTALGFAVSLDGLTWHKHPQNPVFRSAPEREWESHYVTGGETVMRLPDGSYRLWYATRKKPPFVNLYYAIGTARWNGPQ